MHLSGAYSNSVDLAPGQRWPPAEFTYRGSDATIRYHFIPTEGLNSLRAEMNGQSVGSLLDGAQVRIPGATNSVRYTGHSFNENQTLDVQYTDGTTLHFRIWQKSLVVDVINRTGQASELSLGQISGVIEPRTVWVPYLTYGGGPHPSVLVSQGRHRARFHEHLAGLVPLERFRALCRRIGFHPHRPHQRRRALPRAHRRPAESHVRTPLPHRLADSSKKSCPRFPTRSACTRRKPQTGFGRNPGARTTSKSR